MTRSRPVQGQCVPSLPFTDSIYSRVGCPAAPPGMSFEKGAVRRAIIVGLGLHLPCQFSSDQSSKFSGQQQLWRATISYQIGSLCVPVSIAVSFDCLHLYPFLFGANRANRTWLGAAGAHPPLIVRLRLPPAGWIGVVGARARAG